ncbi:hypothetical protein IIA28_19140 [candidate division KSB1 bacterium]|nr:hypothetical protein [candidate division KSB1 bacterium]
MGLKSMKELFYFSQSDLMIQVQYSEASNALSYSSHREITEVERKFVEHYIRTKVTSEAEIDSVSYMGINHELAKELNEYHSKNNLKSLHERHEKVDGVVKGLIKESMANYYFDQIGNKLIEVKGMIQEGSAVSELNREKKNLAELVYAYNIYAEQKVNFEKVLPKELSEVY